MAVRKEAKWVDGLEWLSQVKISKVDLTKEILRYTIFMGLTEPTRWLFWWVECRNAARKSKVAVLEHSRKIVLGGVLWSLGFKSNSRSCVGFRVCSHRSIRLKLNKRWTCPSAVAAIVNVRLDSVLNLVLHGDKVVELNGIGDVDAKKVCWNTTTSEWVEHHNFFY
jgi:hypothetical protein